MTANSNSDVDVDTMIRNHRKTLRKISEFTENQNKTEYLNTR